MSRWWTARRAFQANASGASGHNRRTASCGGCRAHDRFEFWRAAVGIPLLALVLGCAAPGRTLAQSAVDRGGDRARPPAVPTAAEQTALDQAAERPDAADVVPAGAWLPNHPFVDPPDPSGSSSSELARAAGIEPACAPAPFSLHDDLANLRCDLWSDLESVWTFDNTAILLIAGGASFAIHDKLDDRVAANTRRHPNRWGKGSDALAAVGNPGHQFAAITGLYAYSLATQDVEAHELSRTLFDALALTGASTVLLKVATNTRAPNGQPDFAGGAFPSGHVSSSVAFAAVLDEYYGHRIGIPAYVLSGLVAWERIDDREHDLSDVVFGAALGYVIGRTVASRHHASFCGMEVQSFIDPESGCTGIGLERRY